MNELRRQRLRALPFLVDLFLPFLGDLQSGLIGLIGLAPVPEDVNLVVCGVGQPHAIVLHPQPLIAVPLVEGGRKEGPLVKAPAGRGVVRLDAGDVVGALSLYFDGPDHLVVHCKGPNG